MSETKLCYWWHAPLSPLPEDASYVDEFNHTPMKSVWRSVTNVIAA